MEQPTGAAFELGDWAWKALTGVLGMLGWNTLARVRKLEIDRQTTSQAASERAELKQDIRALSDRMDNQHSRIFERLDTIVDGLKK
jgi:hypothetical protein